MVGRWAYYAEGKGAGLDVKNTVRINTPEGLQAEDALRYGMENTHLYFNNLNIEAHVLQQLPEIPFYDSRRSARRLAHGQATASAIKASAQVSRTAVEARQASAMAALDGMAIINMWDAVCDAQTCSALRGDASWYFDNNHIVNQAARALAPRFAPLFKQAASP